MEITVVMYPLPLLLLKALPLQRRGCSNAARRHVQVQSVRPGPHILSTLSLSLSLCLSSRPYTLNALNRCDWELIEFISMGGLHLQGYPIQTQAKIAEVPYQHSPKTVTNIFTARNPQPASLILIPEP